MEGTGRNKGLVGTPFSTLLSRTPLLRRAGVSLPFQVHRLELLVEAGLVAVSSACFEFADEVLEAQHGSLAHLTKQKSSHLQGLSNVAVVEDYWWPCAGGLSAVNAIGTQKRDPMNSGLTRWRMAC